MALSKMSRKSIAKWQFGPEGPANPRALAPMALEKVVPDRFAPRKPKPSTNGAAQARPIPNAAPRQPRGKYV